MMITFRKLSLITVVAALLIAAACGPGDEGDVGMDDGTYTGVSDPNARGYVAVEVVVQDGRIADASMTEYTGEGAAKDPETYPYEEWAEAKEQLPEALVEEQSADVDVFAGATSTSEKFQQAARRALGEEEPVEEGPYADGVHEGVSDESDRGGYVEVEVYVLLGHIVNVEMVEYDGDGEAKDPEEYDYEEWAEAAEALPERAVEAQGTDFDAYAGATSTSEMFRQALERALEGS